MLSQTRMLSALALLGPLTCAASAQCERPWFDPRVIVGEFMTSADADGGGWLEIVTRSSDALYVWTLDQGLAPVRTLVMQRDTRAAAAADFDGDGRDDLAALTLEWPTWTLRVLRNESEQWSEIASFTAAEGTLIVLDHGGDGDPDLALAGEDTIDLYINENGGFTAAGAIAPGGGSDWWAGPADANGLDDIIQRSGGTRAYLQQPDGSFLEAPPIPFSTEDAGDITGDGILDLVGHKNPVHMMPGLGDGSFGARVPIIEDDVAARAIADLDGDGLLDVLAYDANLSGIASFVRRSGSFVRTPGPVPQGKQVLLAGDITGDGLAELIPDGPGVAIFRGREDGAFSVPRHASTPDLARRLTTADLDGDGDQDAALVGDRSFTAFLTIFRNTGGGRLQVWAELELNDSVFEAAVLEDFDGDGDRDIAVWSDDEIVLVENTPDHAFSARRTLDGSYDHLGRRLLVSDLDGNGRPDLILPDGDTTFRVWLNQGDWAFAPLDVPTAHPFLAEVADLTGDGRDDAVMVLDHAIAVLPGLGRGAFGEPILSEVAADYGWLYPGEFDGEGGLDLLAVGGAGISLLLNDGDGRLTDMGVVAQYSNPRGLGVADLDGDGIDDFAAASQTGYRAGLHLSRGDGASFDAIPVLATSMTVTTALTDMNGDGAPDLVMAHNHGMNGPASVSVTLNFCGGILCPVDLHPDGLANTLDVKRFLRLWAGGSPAADWNHDGLIDALDLTAFLDEWADGCP